MSPRRKSIDSSEESYSEDSNEESGSDGSEYGDHKKPKKKEKKVKVDKTDKKVKKEKDKQEKNDKKDKDKKTKKDDFATKTPGHTDISGYAGSGGVPGAVPAFPQIPTTTINNPMSYDSSPPHYGAEPHHQQQHFGGNHGGGSPGFPPPGPHFPGTPDQHASPAGPPPPPSGYRIPLTTQGTFPDRSQTGEAPFKDADGVSPVFIGSALMERSVHPCKIGPHLYQYCSVAYGGGEQAHNGRFDLLPFKPALMEWVRTSNGRIPPGRRPVEGGYEETGSKLYHAVANHNGVMVPGKTGEHLGGANVAFGGAEHVFTDYEILCWR